MSFFSAILMNFYGNDYNYSTFLIVYVRMFVLSVSFTVGGNVSSDVSASLYFYLWLYTTPGFSENPRSQKITFEIHNYI